MAEPASRIARKEPTRECRLLACKAAIQVDHAENAPRIRVSAIVFPSTSFPEMAQRERALRATRHSERETWHANLVDSNSTAETHPACSARTAAPARAIQSSKRS